MATTPTSEPAGRDPARSVASRSTSIGTNGSARTSADRFSFTFDGESIAARPGDTLAVALIAAGRRALRTTSRHGEPRGVFCNMGICFDCLVEVDGRSNVRACQALAEPGMDVRTQAGHGRGEDESEH